MASWHIIQQGNTLRIALNRQHAQAPAIKSADRKTAKRGKITTFSKKSRKRLFELFNRMSYSAVNTYFITLTYQFTSQFQKEHYKLFLRRLERYYGIAFRSAIWRIERQKRGTPHFHIVLFADKRLQYINPNVVARLWSETVGAKATNGNYLFTRIERVWRLKHLLWYVSKYMAKMESKKQLVDTQGTVAITDDGSQASRVGETAGAIGLINAPYQDAPLGRIWGYYRKPALPYAMQYVFSVSTETVIEAKRILRKIIKPKGGWLKRLLVDYHRSCTVFVGVNAGLRIALEA